MSTILQFLGDGGHALAAALFAALAIMIARGRKATPEHNLLFVAIMLTALWGLYTAFKSVVEPMSGVSETLRNGAWLLFMFVLLRRGQGRRSEYPVSITVIYAILAVLLIVQTGADILSRYVQFGTEPFASLVTLSLALRMMVAVGALVLVHNLFTVSAPESRTRIALVMAALAAMWTYDLNLYIIAALSHGHAQELYALRGLAMAPVAIVMALGTRGDGEWRLHVSRVVALRSLSIVAVGLYIVALALVVTLIEWLAGPVARFIEIGAMFATLVAALVLIPSARFRAKVRVMVSKHFFQHRYDYRTEWIRFVDTIGAPGAGAAPFHERVVKAVADITESPCGLLLLPDDSGAMAVECRWNWPGLAIPAQALAATFAAAMEGNGRIIDLDEARNGHGSRDMPTWMLSEQVSWALVPLIHFDRLTGVILLGRPRIDRRLDWEDFDMLRAVGRQVASYLSEAQGQQSLEDVRRFDEFNRRFAFIIHDVKNLVSQLSLLARNAERHAGNPDFRADMLFTLRDSVGKMNDLLARLSQHNSTRVQDADHGNLLLIVRGVAATRIRQHPVDVMGEAPAALALPQRLEQILSHLVQNAIDASQSGAAVTIRLGVRGDCATIKVIDQGCGMSADFIRRDLFKPFVSSKPNGFGIGAFEARELARGMGGRIEVESRLGEGSCFTLLLPLATSHTIPSTERAA